MLHLQNNELAPYKNYKQRYFSNKPQRYINEQPFQHFDSLGTKENLAMSTNENCVKDNLIITSVCNNECENRTVTLEVQQKKTPITLLNEWAMREGNSCENKKFVLYELVAITGSGHRPIFTYKCQANDKTGNLKLSVFFIFII